MGTIGQQGSLSDRISDEVERLIRDEELKTGDQLPPERDMARMLGVSRASLREAVRVLSARGHLIVKHGQGVFVGTPRSERELRTALNDTELSLRELYAMREVLEVPAAVWAAENMTPKQLSEVRAALDSLNAASDAEAIDYEELRHLDANFHLAIAVAARNRFLKQTSSVLHDMVLSGMETTLLIPGRTDIARADHERIFAALAARDVSAVRRAVRSHIRGAHNAASRRVDGVAPARPA